MTKNPNDRPSPENTRIDLGDDLIEKTAVLTRTPSLTPALTPDRPEPIESRLHSARILIGEGLLEQAKRILHKIVVEDSGCVEARNALEEIHDLELKQIFGEETGRKIYGSRDNRIAEVLDAEDVLDQLDRDLSLGLGRAGENRDLPALLRNLETLQEVTARLEIELADVSPQDRIDIGIGFLEMGLPEIASTQFRAALQAFSLEKEPEPRILVSTTCLIAMAMMAACKPLDAEFELQPLLNDSEIAPELKVELFYLMGRVQEQLRKPEAATGWFRQVTEINPKYRDVRERLAKTR